MSDIKIPAEAQKLYLNRRRLDFEKCEKALLEKDYETLSRIAHKIKGNAVTFGYNELALLANHLENYSSTKDTPNLNLVLHQFRKYLSRLQN